MFVQEPWLSVEQKINKGKKVGGYLLGRRKRGKEKRGQKIRMDSERWKGLCVLRPQVRKQPLWSAVYRDPKSGNSPCGQLLEGVGADQCLVVPAFLWQRLSSLCWDPGLWPASQEWFPKCFIFRKRLKDFPISERAALLPRVIKMVQDWRGGNHEALPCPLPQLGPQRPRRLGQEGRQHWSWGRKAALGSFRLNRALYSEGLLDCNLFYIILSRVSQNSCIIYPSLGERECVCNVGCFEVTTQKHKHVWGIWK